MNMYRNSNCLRTLRRRTGTQQHVLEARSQWIYSPSVRSNFIHPLNIFLTGAIAIANPFIGAVLVVMCIGLLIIDWKCRASDMVLIKIDGASHAKKHAQCGSGQSYQEEKRY